MCEALDGSALKKNDSREGSMYCPAQWSFTIIINYMCVSVSCMWVYAHESRCLQRPEEVSDAVKLELQTDSGDLADADARNRTQVF